MGTAIGAGALQRLGLVAWYESQSEIAVDRPEWHRKHIARSTMFYAPDVYFDTSFIERTVRTNFGPMQLPTMERALVDYMRHLDILEELYFVDGLHEYLELYEPDKLLLVAEHYGVRDEMAKWIEEDKDYTNWG